MEPFVPQALTADQVTQLYGTTLAQVEAQVLEAWQATVANPHSQAAAAQYEERLGHLTALRADYARIRTALEPAG